MFIQCESEPMIITHEGVVPHIVALPESLTPMDCFLRLSQKPHCVFLDSALERPSLGRYSFVAADPFAWMEYAEGTADPVAELIEVLHHFYAPTIQGIPPFQGGAAGVFAYELGRRFERIPPTRYNDLPLPVVAVGLYDVVLAFDHREGRGWLVSQGFPEEGDGRLQRARLRAKEFLNWLSEPIQIPPCRYTRTEEIAPQHPIPGLPSVTSNFTRQEYLDAVARVIEYIRAGDVFQVNLSQRLLHPATSSPVELYCRLRQRNPATFAGYLDLGAAQILSSSPERFLRVQDGRVETRPIKGTRPRLAHPEASLFAASELLEDEKERAENVMIVDLLRNDLSRVCDPQSVRVTELCSLEVYQHVQHLVSAVQGELKSGVHPLELLPATFPGGSVTGAPKIRAMEIIAELEPTARTAYCGSLGYVGFNRQMDLNIVIRSVIAAYGWWQIPVGGGITVRSRPAAEYEETLVKASGILQALS
jgi:para-aminobenzoate synthetase component 1